LSVDALQDKFTCKDPAAPADKFVGVEGRVRSVVVVDPDVDPDVDPVVVPEVEPDDVPVELDGPGSAILLREMISSSYQV
jgi:hypothetical protein